MLKHIPVLCLGRMPPPVLSCKNYWLLAPPGRLQENVSACSVAAALGAQAQAGCRWGTDRPVRVEDKQLIRSAAVVELDRSTIGRTAHRIEAQVWFDLGLCRVTVALRVGAYLARRVARPTAAALRW